MRLRLITLFCGLGVAVSASAGGATPVNAVPAAWPKKVVLDWTNSVPRNAWVRRQLPQAHPLLVGRIQVDVSDAYQGDDADDKVPAARGEKPLLVFPPDPFVHDALKEAAVRWFVPSSRCLAVLELGARILHLRQYLQARSDGEVRVVVGVDTSVTARWGSGRIVSRRYGSSSSSEWMPPVRSHYQRFAYPDSLFYPSLYGRVLQAALQRAFGAAMADLAARVRVHPTRRCVNLFPAKGAAG